MLLDYSINDIQPYINWDYFFYAWGIHNKSSAEKNQLRKEAEETLSVLQGSYKTHALFLLLDANSDGDDIVIGPCRLPMLRQQQQGSDYLCLADFLRPLSSGQPDKVGVFATSVDMGLETDFNADSYQKMMVQLLADRLAEATAERMHEEVRKRYWGYVPDEHLSMEELHIEKFQGIRPAVGYPSLPDNSINFLLDSLLDFRQIGIRLTESGAMKPHASVSGFMFSNPEARYFSVGKIGDDQLSDYAHRRALPITVIRKFLYSNL